MRCRYWPAAKERHAGVPRRWGWKFVKKYADTFGTRLQSRELGVINTCKCVAWLELLALAMYDVGGMDSSQGTY